MTSVWTSGSGPSSRTEPTSTNGLPAVTIACITPAVEHALLDRGRDRPAAADRVDGPDVVLVAVLDALAVREVDAERGAVQRRLDVVGGERVAGEQHVDVAGLHQRDHRRGRAGVHDGGPGDPQDLAALPLHLAHLLGDLAHQQRLRLLAGHLRVHELERLLVRLVLAHREHHLDAARAADDPVAAADVADRDGAHPAVVDHQPAVHLRVLDRHPLRRRAGRRSRGWSWSRSRPGRRRRLGASRSTASPGSTRLTPCVCSRISSRCRSSSSSLVTVIRA